MPTLKLGGLGMAIAAASTFVAAPANAQAGPGSWGPGMMGPGMMGPNGCYHCGMMWNRQPANLDLSVADVRSNLAQWLQWNRNTRLKVGSVVAVDDNTIRADIVTVEGGAPVERYIVDRHTGYYRPEQ